MAKIDVLRLNTENPPPHQQKATRAKEKQIRAKNNWVPTKSTLDWLLSSIAPILQSPDVHITVPVEMSSPPLVSTPLER